MTKTITQRVLFRNTSPKKLYDTFLNAKHHGAITGGVAKITPKAGAAFSVHNGYITGKNLQLVDSRLIVQSWVGSDWRKGETDSTFILYFQKAGKDTVIFMTHANIPDEHVEAIRKGWIGYYWKPWKRYLATK